MQLSEFNFELPTNLIANYPSEQRDLSRMLVMDVIIEDKIVRDFPSYLKAGDVVVFNESKVIPARLFTDDNIEIFLHRKIDEHHWQIFAKPAKRLKIGGRYQISRDLEAKIIQKNEDGSIIVEFLYNGDFFVLLEKYGNMPLPPYIKRKAGEGDKSRYQTVYAKEAGSVAAPTAGLHFTDDLIESIKKTGAKTAFVTLHVGAGTFMPVKVENIHEHKMHLEYYSVSDETAEIINSAKRIVAIGTTSIRTLESVAIGKGKIRAGSGDTGIFITPGYEWQIVDMLFTNFHLPKSTLFMLVAAFIGLENAHKAYQHAIKQQYRFYSYGDACLFYKST